MTTFKLPVSLYDKFKIDDVIFQVCEIAFLLDCKLVPYNIMIHYEEHFTGGFHPLTEILNRFTYRHELCFNFEKIIKDNDEFYHNIINIKNFNLLISAKDYDYTDYDITSPGYITIFYKDFYKYLVPYIDYRIMV